MDQELKNRFGILNRDISKVESYRDILSDQIKSLDKNVKDLNYRAELNQNSSEVFKSWLEELLNENINSISDLATTGLRNIIDDQNLTFKIKPEYRNNRLWMKFVLDNNGIEGDPISSFGGGIVLIVSLILRLSMMSRLKTGNLLLLDESMSAVANRYVPAAADFMKYLSEQLGINILMVTHNDEFMDNAHIAYEGSSVIGSDGNSSLQLRRKVD